MSEKVDILAIGAHPDDVELSCSGTLLKHIQHGYSVAIADLTQGELGTRGSAELRLEEATASQKYMGVSHRVNLGLADGFFESDRDSLIKLVEVIRRFQPEIVLANAVKDRHPDHASGATFASKACFLAGLVKIETSYKGQTQERWRPKSVYHYIQDYNLHPDLIIDITEFFDRKMGSIKCFKSQFYDPNSTEPDSPISGKSFLDYMESKARMFGRYIDVEYAEGFNVARPIGISDLLKVD